MKKNNSKTNKHPFTGTIEDYTAICSTDQDSISCCTGYASIASNTGKEAFSFVHKMGSVAVCTGDKSSAISNDAWSLSVNTGRVSTANSKGYCSIAACTTERSVATAKGTRSIAASTGDYGVTQADGNAGIAIITGRSSEAIAAGSGSLAIATGENGILKGVIGSVLIWVIYKNYNTVDKVFVRTVDGDMIKENTYYKVKDDDVVEVVDENHKYGFSVEDKIAKIFNLQW